MDLYFNPPKISLLRRTRTETKNIVKNRIFMEKNTFGSSDAHCYKFTINLLSLSHPFPSRFSLSLSSSSHFLRFTNHRVSHIRNKHDLVTILLNGGKNKGWNK